MNKLKKNRERHGHSHGESKRHSNGSHSNGYTNTRVSKVVVDHNSLLNGHTNSCRNRCLLFSFFFIFFLIYFHNLSEKQEMNGRTKMTRANSLRTSRCLLFSLFFVVVIFSFIFKLFILLVFVSKYLFHVCRSLYLYNKQ